VTSFRTIAAALCVASALTLSGMAARAQTPDPEAVALARELMQVTLVDQLHRQMVEQGWTPIEGLIRQSGMAVSAEQIAEIKVEYNAIVEEEIARTVADTPALYARFFSAQELRDMLDFYRTPTGKKTIEVMPALLAEVTQSLTPRMIEVGGRMQAAVTRVLKKRGVETPPAPR
jgi:hypothetical protein